jgi:stage V sporulation protein G
VEITEVRIKLMEDPHDRLQAFCSITFDACFVIRDLKIIQGSKGSFVAMPSRKLTDRCPRCFSKNHLRALHCNQCGAKLDDERATKDCDGRAKLYADIAHPINSSCRELIQLRVLEAYSEELVKAGQPDYRCTYDDYDEDRFATLREDADDEPIGIAVSRTDSGTRRVEPGIPQPGPPHLELSSRPRESVHAAVPSGHSSDEDDSFGAGLD